MTDDLKRNIELKATDPDPAGSRQTCVALGAEDRGEIWQRDTYFPVPLGRLKLREQLPGAPHLIHYSRTDEPQQRESRYRIVALEDAAKTIEVLSAALGLGGQVIKRRRLLLWQDVRIHLDDVEALGTFIELEAVARPESDLTREHQLIGRLRVALNITETRLVAHGYADQLLSQGQHPPALSTTASGPPATGSPH